MISRLFAIISIYVCVSVAWIILGTTVMVRSDRQDGRLRGEVGKLWGTTHRQQAPEVWYEIKSPVQTQNIEGNRTNTVIRTETVTRRVPLESSKINVDLALEHRRKGLLWYATYKIRFASRYTIANKTGQPQEFFVKFPFPAEGAVYDNFRLAVAGKAIENVKVHEAAVRESLKLGDSESGVVEVSYDSLGLDQWWYDFGSDVSQVKDFALTMKTDFERIDFPENSISPTTKTQCGNGWQLEWKYTNLLTGVKIGMEMPKKLNPGPWVSEVTYFAPVSLFLFFFVLFVFTAIRDINVHPMNYFFLGCAFFSFHLLMAYLVDHISVHAAFTISAAVSVLLVVTYMRLVVGARVAFVEIAFSQLVYMVLFSYAFFWEGYTGLAITILCILTLFVVMQFTGRTDWAGVFRKTERPGSLPSPPRIKNG
jgi:hypothetical protein